MALCNFGILDLFEGIRSIASLQPFEKSFMPCHDLFVVCLGNGFVDRFDKVQENDRFFLRPLIGNLNAILLAVDLLITTDLFGT